MTALQAGQPGDWDSVPGRVGIFVITVTRRVLGLIQASPQCVFVALSPGVKQQVQEADHSTLSNVEIMNVWSFTSTPVCLYVFMA
jgi:hypothetical protein